MVAMKIHLEEADKHMEISKRSSISNLNTQTSGEGKLSKTELASSDTYIHQFNTFLEHVIILKWLSMCLRLIGVLQNKKERTFTFCEDLSTRQPVNTYLQLFRTLSNYVQA